MKIFYFCIKEFRVLTRDLKNLGLLFLMPITFIVVLSFAMQDIFEEKTTKRIVIALQAHEQSQDIDAFERTLAEGAGFMVVKPPVDLNAKTVFKQYKAKFLIEISSGFSIDGLLKEDSQKQMVEKVKILANPMLDQSLKGIFLSQLVLILQRLTMERVQKQLATLDEDLGEVDFAKMASGLQQNLQLSSIGNITLPSPLQHNIPAWSLFAMFFIALPLSQSIEKERRSGTLLRLLTLKLPKTVFLGAKLLPYFIINNIQFYSMLAVGAYFLPMVSGMQLNLPAFLPLMCCTCVASLVATSYGLMVSSLAESSEQASTISSISTIVLAALGGVMVPHFVMPEFMQTLAKVSPLFWALDAYQGIFVRGEHLAEIGIQLAVLCGFSTMFFGVALSRFRWR